GSDGQPDILPRVGIVGRQSQRPDDRTPLWAVKAEVTDFFWLDSAKDAGAMARQHDLGARQGSDLAGLSHNAAQEERRQTVLGLLDSQHSQVRPTQFLLLEWGVCWR